MASKSHYPGEIVTHRGVYLISHYLHRPNHHCRIDGGSFPTCNVCLQHVRFEIVPGNRTAPSIWEDADFRPIAAAAKLWGTM